MKRSRQCLLRITGLVVALILIALVYPAIKQLWAPRYQGRTADQWLDHYAKRHRQGYPLDDLASKELEVAFRELGAEAEELLLEEVFSYRPAEGFQSRFYRFGEFLPEPLRLRFLRDPLPRYQFARGLISSTRPDWELFEPFVEPGLNADDTKVIAHTTFMLGFVGDGACHAIPILVQARTNATVVVSQTALQSLMQLGMNALPALPAIIDDLENDRWAPQHLGILQQLGPLADRAVPVLESVLNQTRASAGELQLTATLLAIDSNHQVAMKRFQVRLQEAIGSSNGGVDAASVFHVFDRVRAPNPAVARLLRQFGETNGWDDYLLQLLVEHDPERAIHILKDRIGARDTGHLDEAERINAATMLLKHEPNEAMDLSFFRARYLDGDQPMNPTDEVGLMTWLVAFQHGTSDSPGVMELLDDIDQLELSEYAATRVQETRRHIELNDRLRMLRSDDHRAD